MSILIADSGSTKTQWNLVSEDKKVKESFSIGINPYFISKNQIIENLKQHFTDIGEREEVDKLFFYGSGCSLADKCEIVYSALKEVFVNANIEVASDLLASARAVFSNSKGISCILGTGSNVAIYNGEKFTGNINSLGYALGDQASGAYIGKELIRSFFQAEMPIELRIKFQQSYNVDLATVLDNVYNNKFPNRYLAGFATFASQNIENVFIKSLITKGIQQFILLQLGSLNFDKSQYEVGFVGSVAYYFKDILISHLELSGYKVGKIIKAPMEGLLEFHL